MQKNIIKFTPALIAAIASISASAKYVAHFTMDCSQNKITESLSGISFNIDGRSSAENITGADGAALRFDGYTTFVDASLGNILTDGSDKLSASVRFAIETYPIVEIDVNTPEQVAVASCLDDKNKTGFGFFLGFDGKYSFKAYVGGWPLEMKVNTPLPQYEWINLTAVIDSSARTATLYNNGVSVASSKANGKISSGDGNFRIGRSTNERFSGPFCLTSFNGAIDDIAIWDEALSPETVKDMAKTGEAILSVSPERFSSDPMRPTFHGMPSANWTNESHGMTFSDGRYHVFFQKNANGPYMSRLHWGHISSENLYDWREEKIAITPGAPFDIKGCWSGCVFSDDAITQGKPSIIYTAVDYAKATIAQANPSDESLIDWQKVSVPIINGRPSGLSDDFRDPYFFRSDDGAHIIVGSIKNGIGTTTLHTYNPVSHTWSNDGNTFFSGTDAATCGTFWEMPNVTKMGDKWLFTTTPLNTAKGVASLYWTGTINPDGTFNPDKTNPVNVELPGFARDGYGMLSPTIFQHNGKTIVIGIVPDKLSGHDNYNLGYAHTYCLPREWSLDKDGILMQKPYSGLEAMRSDNGFSKSDFTLDGNLTLDNVNGRAIELSGTFTVSNGKCGFTLLDDGSSSIKVYYDGATNEIIVDSRGVDRLINDAGIFDGLYRSILPRQLAKGENIKLNVFLDHSILDIFINDTWASSVRIFANGKSTENVTAFADAPNNVRSLQAWKLQTANGSAGIDSVISGTTVSVSATDGTLHFNNIHTPALITVHNIAGEKLIERYIYNQSGYIDTDLKGIHIVTIQSSEKTDSTKVVF